MEHKRRPSGSSGFVLRFVLAFVAGLFGVTMILIASSATKPIGHYAFGAFCLGVSALCFAKGRVARFIGSAIAIAVLFATIGFLVDELSGGALIQGARSNTSAFGALMAFVAFGLPAFFYLRNARFGFGPELPIETIEFDDEGITRIVGFTRAKVAWNDISEIWIVTTDGGPYAEDVFFAFVSNDEEELVVSRDAATRHGLLEQLQSRLSGINNDAVIEAMGCTSNRNFLIWKRT